MGIKDLFTFGRAIVGEVKKARDRRAEARALETENENLTRTRHASLRQGPANGAAMMP